MTSVSGGGLTFTWRDGQSGDWTNSADWTTQSGAPGVPGASDTAVLGGFLSYTVTISTTDQATANVLSWTNAEASLVVSGTLTLNDVLPPLGGTMQIQGGNLNLALPSSGGTASLDGIIDLSDGGISAQVASSSASGTTGGTADFTLGATLVQVAGTSNSVNLSVGGSPVVSNSLTNKGIIQAGVAGGQFQVSVQAALSTGGGPFYGVFTNSGTIDVANGELFDASGTNFDNAGYVNIGSGSTAVFGIQSWDNMGSITVDHGATLTLRGDYSDAANIINNGGTVILEGTPANFAEITASSGTLVLDPSYLIPPSVFSPPGTPARGGVVIRGHLYIDSGATLHLRGAPASGYVTSDSVTFNGTGATLALDAPGDLVGQVNGAVVGDVFDLVSAGFDTLRNGPRPIKWIGRRSYAGRFARGAHVRPICFKTGALDVNQPRRDLWVSPHHAMFLDGVLIEAIDLVNGVSIFQAERVERVDYFHIELETHDVIVAEGALSESFVDDDSRAMFHNASEFAALYPDLPAAPARYCAPRRAFGAEVETARKRIAQRAAIPYVPTSVPDRPRALVVDAQVPVLGHDGGSNAVLDHIRALQNAGFAVSFFALDGADQDLKTLSSLGVPLLRGAFSEVARQHARQFDLVYLHRVTTATRCLKAVQQYFDAQVVYSVADLHHLRIKAQSRFDRACSAELIEQAQNLALQEIAAALSADCVVTHSVSEGEQLRQIPSLAAARKIRVIPWTLSAAPVRLPFGKRSGLAFIGGFAHAPNVDAARWLVHEIMPLVWREAPEVECLIAGSDLSDDLHQELAQPGVSVLGRVDQLGDVFWRVRLTVAPLRFGAGLKDKVLRSMAAGLPCVGTPEAFSGMQALPAMISNDCQAQTSSDLAAAIVRMHRDPTANAGCGAAGLGYIATFYNRARVDALIREMAQPALDHYRARTGRRSDCAVLQFGAAPLAIAALTPKKVIFR